MSKTIYNLFLLRRPTERWLRLSQARRTALFTQLNEGLAATGGRHVIVCRASWCNQGYRGWGVEEFPDFAAWRQFADLREKLEWYSYHDSWSVLGTWHEAMSPAKAEAPEQDKVYQLFLMQGFTEAYEQLTQEEKDALWAKEQDTRQDAKLIIVANCYWASEEHRSFGVLMFPDIDSVQHHFTGVTQIGWPRYVRGRILLGTLWEV